MKNILPQPRIHVSLSLDELLALLRMITLGKMFTRPQERQCVEAVMTRIAKALAKLGAPEGIIGKLVKL